MIMDISSKSSTTNYDRITLESVLDSVNLINALQRVIANKGAAGVDGMTTDEIRAFYKENSGSLREAVRTGKYTPSPIRRVYIPKDNGQLRPLGIPTVIDRLVQQAVAQVLSDVYDKDFSDNSFGYRPSRSARDAVRRVVQIANNGYQYVIDLDLSKFFDTVNHSKLLQILSSKIKDGRVISLIHKFLKAPVFENGKIGPKTTMGTPQGGCISPILANILLNELDQLLDQRGVKFVRYADDMCIFAKSQRAAERILGNVTRFIEKDLFLKVNMDKTKICRTGPEMQILGFTLVSVKSAKLKRVLPRYCRLYPSVTLKKRKQFEIKVKRLLSRKAPGGIQQTLIKYNMFVRGWHNYYKGALPIGWTKDMCSRIRRRIRQLYWKQWKTAPNRHENAKKRWRNAPELGMRGEGALSYSSNRYWRIAKSLHLHKILGNMQIESEGWLSLDTLEAAHWDKMELRKNIGTAVCGSARTVV